MEDTLPLITPEHLRIAMFPQIDDGVLIAMGISQWDGVSASEKAFVCSYEDLHRYNDEIDKKRGH